MHRLTGILLALLAACGGGGAKPAETTKAKAETDGDTAAPAAEKDGGAAPVPEKKDVCTGFDIANLEDMLVKSDCEVPDVKPDSMPNPDLKGKLEVTLAASPTKVSPGGKVDLQVTFTNKTQQPLTLHFRIDPVARFETEVYDAKKKRVDMPAGTPPPPPKGHSAPPPADAKVARVTIAPSGYARARIPWDAVKMKWAPDKVRGTAVEKGYPRAAAGPLTRGKYSVRLVTPLVGVFEGAEREVSAPKIDIEVGG